MPAWLAKIFPCSYGTCACTPILLKVPAFYLSTSPKTIGCTCTCTSTNVKVLVLYLSTFKCTSPHAWCLSFIYLGDSSDKNCGIYGCICSVT